MDDIDRQIVELLRENGRRTNVEIARELELSEGTVRKRLDRLLLQKAVRIVGIPDPEVAGCTVRTLISLNVELPHIGAVSQALRERPEVMSVYRVSGEYDLLIEAVFASNEALMSFLSTQLARWPGVVSSKTSHVLQIVKHGYEWAWPPPAPPRILIVDDDPDFVEVTRMVLAQAGYDIREAHNGDEALDRVRADAPDLVILDIMMDGILDGWDASRRIRALQRWHHVPILVVSSITSSEYLGMLPTDDDNLIDYFLAKPVNPQKLVTEVERLLKRR